MTLSDIAQVTSGLLPGTLHVVAPTSAQLATHLALVSSDNAFQRTARLTQSLWRERHGYPIGLNGTTPLGSRLAMPFAKDTLANYLTDTIREVVRAEVINCSAASGQRRFPGIEVMCAEDMDQPPAGFWQRYIVVAHSTQHCDFLMRGLCDLHRLRPGVAPAEAETPHRDHLPENSSHPEAPLTSVTNSLSARVNEPAHV